MPNEKITGAEFKKHRLFLGLTQAEMAKTIGLQTITVQKYEGNPTRLLPGYVTKLIRLARLEKAIDRTRQ